MREILGRLPADIDWRIWCVATSPRFQGDGLLTIQRDWTVLDVLRALDVLAALGEIEEALTPKPPPTHPRR